jgi:hypothetical protein
MPSSARPISSAPAPARTEPAPPLARHADIARWGYRPVWRPRPADCEIDVETELAQADPQSWLVLADEAGLAAAVTGGCARPATG